MRTFDGVKQIAKTAGVRLDVWNEHLNARVDSDVVLVVASHPAGTIAAAKALNDHVSHGGLAIICGDPDGDVSSLLSQLGPVGLGDEIIWPTENPIVGERHSTAHGIAGDAVFNVHVEGVRAVAGAPPILIVEGGVLGVLRQQGSGALVVLGDADIFTDVNIARDQNADFFVAILRTVFVDVSVDVGRALANGGLSIDRRVWPTFISIDLAEQALAIAAAARQIDGAYGDTTSESAIIEAKSLVGALGTSALRGMATLTGDGCRPAAIIFTNVPYVDPGPTPPTPRRHSGGYNEALAIFMSVALGEPVAYRQESLGKMVQHIIPTQADINRQTSGSSGARLFNHTEQAFHSNRPGTLALHCLTGDPYARTIVASVPLAMAQLNLSDITTLSEARYRTSVDASFGGDAREDFRRLSKPFAVLAGDPFNPFVTFDLDLMVSMDPDAARALTHLNDAIEATCSSIALKRQDVVAIDNRAAVHGRSRFTARFDGTDRWLLRTLTVGQLPLSDDRTGRIIETRYL